MVIIFWNNYSHSYRVIIFVINLSLPSISWFRRFHEDFPLKEGTVRVPLPFSRNRPENHSHNLGKALGERLGSLCAPFTSLSLSPLSLSLSLSLSLIYPSLSISLLLPFFISLSFSLSFSLAYLMDVFVLVYRKGWSAQISEKKFHVQLWTVLLKSSNCFTDLTKKKTDTFEERPCRTLYSNHKH